MSQPSSTTMPLNPIDPQFIVNHGESPTAMILAIAIFTSILIGSIKELVRAIVVARIFRCRG